MTPRFVLALLPFAITLVSITSAQSARQSRLARNLRPRPRQALPPEPSQRRAVELDRAPYCALFRFFTPPTRRRLRQERPADLVLDAARHPYCAAWMLGKAISIRVPCSRRLLIENSALLASTSALVNGRPRPSP